MSLSGSRSPEAEAKAAIEDAKKSRPHCKPKLLESIECTCGGGGLSHKAVCPRGRAIRYRQKKRLPLT